MSVSTPLPIINRVFHAHNQPDQPIETTCLTLRGLADVVGRLRLQDNRCCFCGHAGNNNRAVLLIPSCRGGIRSIGNTALACLRCADLQSGQTAAEFLERILDAAGRLRDRLANGLNIKPLTELSTKRRPPRVRGAAAVLPVLDAALPHVPRDYVPDWLGLRLRAKLRAKMLQDDPSCTYCGGMVDHETGTLDHVIPQVRGGSCNAANLALSCRTCNHLKADRTPAEFHRARFETMTAVCAE